MTASKGFPFPVTCSLFSTPIGWCGTLASQRGLVRLYIGYAQRNLLLNKIMDAAGESMKKISAGGVLANKIKRYCSGEKVSFVNCMVDWSSSSSFQRTVLRATREIPYGAVTTYGRLARKVGCPRGSRAVGNVLARNPFPLVIPCHRVVREDGKLGGFSAGEGAPLKKKLLCLEQSSTPQKEMDCPGSLCYGD